MKVIIICGYYLCDTLNEDFLRFFSTWVRYIKMVSKITEYATEHSIDISTNELEMEIHKVNNPTSSIHVSSGDATELKRKDLLEIVSR